MRIMVKTPDNVENKQIDKSVCFHVHQIFFISNLGFCVELGLLNSETEIGTGVA